MPYTTKSEAREAVKELRAFAERVRASGRASSSPLPAAAMDKLIEQRARVLEARAEELEGTIPGLADDPVYQTRGDAEEAIQKMEERATLEEWGAMHHVRVPARPECAGRAKAQRELVARLRQQLPTLPA